jgi:hypothetical protein
MEEMSDAPDGSDGTKNNRRTGGAAPIRHTTIILKRRRRGAILFISDGLKSHGS